MNINEIIITLQQLKGCGPKSQMVIMEYIINNKMFVESTRSLYELCLSLAEKKILKRFPAFQPSDFIAANQVAIRIMDASADQSIGMLNYWDVDYPAVLKKTIDETGKECPPLLLYYKGDLSVLKRKGIAVIGTREPTPEGVHAGEYFSGFFAKRGFNIVSGLALGCDTSGHKGALDMGGVTTAFLAHGLDTVYPPQNEELAEQIVANGGLLLSEYPVGATVNPYRLVERDRLQAGLSVATIVVQTGVAGGTNHAANTTLLAKKPLYVVEFKSDSIMEDSKVAGNRRLVEKGGKYINSKTDLSEIETMLKGENIRQFKPTLW